MGITEVLVAFLCRNDRTKAVVKEYYKVRLENPRTVYFLWRIIDILVATIVIVAVFSALGIGRIEIKANVTEATQLFNYSGWHYNLGNFNIFENSSLNTKTNPNINITGKNKVKVPTNIPVTLTMSKPNISLETYSSPIE